MVPSRTSWGHGLCSVRYTELLIGVPTLAGITALPGTLHPRVALSTLHPLRLNHYVDI